MAHIDQALFNAHEHALETQEQCPECGALLHLRRSKKGLFLGCSAYPACNYLQPLTELEQVVQKVLDQACPECAHPLALKKGRFGLFIGCTHYPECHYHARLDEPEQTGEPCPICKQGKLVERLSRYGKYFYACDGYPKCKFALNYKPVAGRCEVCGFPLLVERKLASGRQLQCADKRCGKKQSLS